MLDGLVRADAPSALPKPVIRNFRSTDTGTPTPADAGISSSTTGTGSTINCPDPETPAVVAVIWDVPDATAVAFPSTSTVAMASVEDHVNTNPSIALPRASVVVPVKTEASPREGTVTLDGVTATTAISWATDTATPLLSTPSMVAMIDAVPSDTAVTIPVALTSATPGSEDAQANVVGNVEPAAVWAVAESCIDSPKETSVTALGVTPTDNTVVSGSVDVFSEQANSSPVAMITRTVAGRAPSDWSCLCTVYVGHF